MGGIGCGKRDNMRCKRAVVRAARVANSGNDDAPCVLVAAAAWAWHGAHFSCAIVFPRSLSPTTVSRPKRFMKRENTEPLLPLCVQADTIRQIPAIQARILMRLSRDHYSCDGFSARRLRI